jgi:hypothetical protein
VFGDFYFGRIVPRGTVRRAPIFITALPFFPPHFFSNFSFLRPKFSRGKFLKTLIFQVGDFQNDGIDP